MNCGCEQTPQTAGRRSAYKIPSCYDAQHSSKDGGVRRDLNQGPAGLWSAGLLYVTKAGPMCELTSKPVADVVSMMELSTTYPECPSTVDVIETHISWVFLTERFAYKLKKPVRFDFLDFSTADLRRRACQRELALNRRLARNVYLDVLPITKDTRGAIRLGGHGTPVDWVVKMRRLPADRTLERLALDGGLTSRDVENLANVLATFYFRKAPLTLRATDWLQHIRAHVQSNLHELLRLLPADQTRIRRSHSAQLRFLWLKSHLLENRVCDGRIVDGHGDLRPEHIYLTSKPLIIDCIEFNDEYRQNDIVDELSFLAMECDRLEIPTVGETLLARYAELSGDVPDRSLVNFYKMYRASVRAKVAAIRAEQVFSNACQSPTAQQYLARMDAYLPALGPPLLIVVGGLMGTGKSTLATALADALSAPLFQTDQIRLELYGKPTRREAHNTGRYSPTSRLRVYKEMVARAGCELDHAATVILDGTFGLPAARELAENVARRAGAEMLLIKCECPRAEVLARISQRLQRGEDASEARPDLYDEQAAEDSLGSANRVICVDTTLGLTDQLDGVRVRLNRELFANEALALDR